MSGMMDGQEPPGPAVCRGQQAADKRCVCVSKGRHSGEEWRETLSVCLGLEEGRGGEKAEIQGKTASLLDSVRNVMQPSN